MIEQDNFEDSGQEQLPDYLLQEIQTKITDHRARQNRPWSYYEKMRKEKPKDYWKPATQAQMLKDYQALGDKFEDGNLAKFQQVPFCDSDQQFL